ncbi:MAG: hypothetical protein ACXAC8_01280 [Candidatus Hodarchaeales archaeon]
MVSSHRRKWRKKSTERRKNHSFAKEAITFLVEESLKIRVTDPQRSQELFCDARKIGRKMRLHLPRRYRFLFCRSCGYPLTINTARIRLNNKKRQIHYQCLNCNNEQRFGFSKKD